MEGRQSSIDELCNLCLAKQLRQAEKLLRIRCLSYTPTPLQHLDVKEAQRRKALRLCSAPASTWKTSAPDTGGYART